MGKIFNTLNSLGLASVDAQEQFSQGTRDNPALQVYRDRVSGVIYIDEFYVGDATYESGEYRKAERPTLGITDYERFRDMSRRIVDYRQFYVGRDIVDFGCGEGDFLRAARPFSRSVTGIELQADVAERLRLDGIDCFNVLPDETKFDAAFCFHVVEHLPDPLETLRSIRHSLRPDSVLIVEVPHANDFLLASQDFKRFTLWSQHLVLHTRESLKRLLEAAGFSQVVIQGKQRYPLSNHLEWLMNGRPGGHKRAISALDNVQLSGAYEAALQQIDATDTIVAVATV